MSFSGWYVCCSIAGVNTFCSIGLQEHWRYLGDFHGVFRHRYHTTRILKKKYIYIYIYIRALCGLAESLCRCVKINFSWFCSILHRRDCTDQISNKTSGLSLHFHSSSEPLQYICLQNQAQVHMYIL
jgi:hypothetical protein